MKRSGYLLFLLLELIGWLSINEAFSFSLSAKPASNNRFPSTIRYNRHSRRPFTGLHTCLYLRPHHFSSVMRSRNRQGRLLMKNNYNHLEANSSLDSDRVRPFPNMPSQHFLSLAQSQLDLLSSTLQFSGTERTSEGSRAKVQSMALYLPRENASTGQLEFVPVVTWPTPGSQRIWIASDALSKQPPSIPKTLTRIPGFTHAKSLLPRYPFAAHQELSSDIDAASGSTNSMSCGVGPVEAIRCQSIVRGGRSIEADHDHGQGEVLSVALYRGSLTVGVLLVWPATSYTSASSDPPLSFWTKLNYKQVSNAAYGLSIALSMDIEGSHQEELISTATNAATQWSSAKTAATTMSANTQQQPSPNRIINGGMGTDNLAQPNDRVYSKETMNADLYAYISAQAYRDLVQAQLTQTEHLRRALSDNLHQVKNPLQALRAFGKLLQRKLALDEPPISSSEFAATERIQSITPLRELADRMMIQTDRVIELLKPMENMVYQLEGSSSNSSPQNYLYLPAGSNSNSTLNIHYYLKLAPADDSSEEESGSLRYLYLPGSNGDSSPTIHYLNPAKYGKSDDVTLAPSQSIRNSQQSAFAAKGINVSDYMLETEKKQQPISFVSSSFNNNFASELASQGSSTENPAESSRRQYGYANNEAVILNNLSGPSRNIPQGSDENIEMAFVSDVTEPILSNAAVVAADRRIKFEVIPFDEDNLPGVKICPSSLQEALSNVIDNAIKYVVLRRTSSDSASSLDTSNPDPHVRVSVVPNAEPEYPKGVSIIVEDNGPGIPRNERESIFRRGFRGIHTKDVLSGNGLGLDISRSMLSRFGGILEVLENGPQNLNGTVMRIMVFR